MTQKPPNPYDSMGRRQRVAYAAGVVVAPFVIPFLIGWFAYGHFDAMYEKSRGLPEQLRLLVIDGEACSSDMAAFRKQVRMTLGQCGGAVPDGSSPTLVAADWVADLGVPVMRRGVSMWSAVAETCDVLWPVSRNPAAECRDAGLTIRRAADDLEKALAHYAEIRTLLQVLLYVWLVVEVLAWGAVFAYARHMWRARQASRSS